MTMTNLYPRNLGTKRCSSDMVVTYPRQIGLQVDVCKVWVIATFDDMFGK